MPRRRRSRTRCKGSPKDNRDKDRKINTWIRHKQIKKCRRDQLMLRAQDTDDHTYVTSPKGGSVDLSSRYNTVTNLGISDIVSGYPDLRRLDLSNCWCVDDYTMELVAKYCGNLTIINLSWCTNITREGLDDVTKGCTTLTDLTISHCCFSNKDLECIPKNCTNVLTSLDISECEYISENIVEEIIEKCRNLETLKLGRCWTVTNDGIEKIAKIGPSSLRFLDISNFNNPYFDMFLDDDTVRHIIERCENLTELNLTGSLRMKGGVFPDLSHGERLRLIV